MNRRPSVTNIFPIDLQSTLKPEETKVRRHSVAVKDERPHKDRSTSEERIKTPLILEPPIRRVSTAVTPLAKLEEAKKRRPSQHTAPNLLNLDRLPDRLRQPSSTLAPNLFEEEMPDMRMAISRNKSPSKAELDSIRTELKLAETAQKNLKPAINADDVKQLHFTLKESYGRQKTFEMSFRPPRRQGDSIKSHDSGMSSSSAETNENVVEEWKQRWSKEKAGSGQGEIKGIKDICFMDNGMVAVTEEKNSRIQIFSKKKGESIKLLDGSSATRRMQPVGICQLPSRTFLAATDMKRIVYFEPLTYGMCEARNLDKHRHLHGMAVNSKEHLLITDLDKKRVYTYDISGTQILTFKQDDFLRPAYVAVSEEYSMVFVSDSEQGCVYMLSMDGELLNKIGRQGDEKEKLVYPLGVCCQPNGKLIVADRGQNRISTYDFRARCYEHLLTRDDLLYSPTCIATDGDRYLAVAEENHDFKVDEYKLKMFYKCRR